MNKNSTPETVPLWSGRFEKKAKDALWDFTVSHEDQRLLSFDIQGSQAHVSMLASVKLLTEEEKKSLLSGLEIIASEVAQKQFQFEKGDEDVHSAVERRLHEISGEVAGKLHTGRSRNDQIVLDMKLYLRDALDDRVSQLGLLVRALVLQAEKNKNRFVPAYTHLQQAQGIPLSHHLLAYAWMFVRDIERFLDAGKRMNSSPLGAGAVGGSSLPLDPAKTAQILGFAHAFDNSMDAVGSRDFISEYLFCIAQTMVHISRLSEELVLWSTREFGWINLPDELATGSSMLPQKKNPDIAELARGKSASAIGYLMALLTLQKGLPLAYNRDFQEDKKSLFQSDDLLSSTLVAITTLIEGVEFQNTSIDPFTCAIDLAETLVIRGVPFRQAHRAVGGLVASLIKSGKTFKDLRSEELKAAHPQFKDEDLTLLSIEGSIQRRQSPGGGSIHSVETQITKLKRMLTGMNE